MGEGMLAGDFMDRGDPEIPWIVERFIARGTVTTLWATQGRGKTHNMIRLVDAVAGNKDSFLGLPVKFHGPCLYLVAETPGMFKQALVSHPGGFPRDNVLIMPGWSLRTADGWLKFGAICRGAAVVVLDPVTSLDWAVKISDNDVVNDIMRRFDQIASKTGAAIILVLHRKKVTHAEAEYGSEEAEEASALGAVAWLAKAAGRFQLLKDRRHGLILKAWPSKIPTFEMLKLKTDKFGFHEIRGNDWRAGSFVVGGEVVIPEDSAGSSP